MLIKASRAAALMLSLAAASPCVALAQAQPQPPQPPAPADAPQAKPQVQPQPAQPQVQPAQPQVQPGRPQVQPGQVPVQPGQVQVQPGQVQPGQQVPDSAAQQQQPSQAYRVKQILGAKVSIEGNMAIGTVDDLVFDDMGQVEYLVVQNEGKMITVPWQAAKFNFEQRSAMIDITPQQYQKIPTYTTQQYPAYFSTPYRTQTYGYYGLTPRQQRIQRRAGGI